MAEYQVNEKAVAAARRLIKDGRVDVRTEWSDAAPSTEQANDLIERHGYAAYGDWHLGLTTDASGETKGRYAFPFGDFSRVNRAALIHAKQRASQNDHDEIADAADRLLRLVDESSS